jgi:hypothetical protein
VSGSPTVVIVVVGTVVSSRCETLTLPPLPYARRSCADDRICHQGWQGYGVATSKTPFTQSIGKSDKAAWGRLGNFQAGRLVSGRVSDGRTPIPTSTTRIKGKRYGPFCRPSPVANAISVARAAPHRVPSRQYRARKNQARIAQGVGDSLCVTAITAGTREEPQAITATPDP